MADKPDPKRDSPPSATAGSRKRYETPKLTDYGPVSKLTQTGGITVRDRGTQKGICL